MKTYFSKDDIETLKKAQAILDEFWGNIPSAFSELKDDYERGWDLYEDIQENSGFTTCDIATMLEDVVSVIEEHRER